MVLPDSGGYWELCIDQIAIRYGLSIACVDDRLSVYVKHLLYRSSLFPAMFIARCIAISSSVYTCDVRFSEILMGGCGDNERCRRADVV